MSYDTGSVARRQPPRRDEDRLDAARSSCEGISRRRDRAAVRVGRGQWPAERRGHSPGRSSRDRRRWRGTSRGRSGQPVGEVVVEARTRLLVAATEGCEARAGPVEPDAVEVLGRVAATGRLEVEEPGNHAGTADEHVPRLRVPVRQDGLGQRCSSSTRPRSLQAHVPTPGGRTTCRRRGEVAHLDGNARRERVGWSRRVRRFDAGEPGHHEPWAPGYKLGARHQASSRAARVFGATTRNASRQRAAISSQSTSPSRRTPSQPRPPT